MPQHRGGKKGKKKDERPSRKRYHAEERWKINKAKKMAKHQRFVEKKLKEKENESIPLKKSGQEIRSNGETRGDNKEKISGVAVGDSIGESIT